MYGRRSAAGNRLPAHRPIDCRIEVATGDVPDSVGHGQYRQTESQGDTEQANPDVGKGGGQHSAPTAPQDQPEGADKLRGDAFA